MTNGDAIIAGDGPYTLLANNPEMYLQYRADGTVWARLPDGRFVEVIERKPPSTDEIEVQRLREAVDEFQGRNERQAAKIKRMREALERIEACADDSYVMRDIAREALRKDK